MDRLRRIDRTYLAIAIATIAIWAVVIPLLFF
jgi:hypothetical protein